MKYYVLAMKDRAADVFAVPMFVVNKGSAVRSFGDEINRSDEKNQLYKHPEDFDLYELGEYEDSTAEFKTEGVPRLLARGQDLKR